MNEIEIRGVGMSEFGRFPDLTLTDLARTAVVRALADADVRPTAIDEAYVSNSLGGALGGQHQIRGQSVLREVGIEGIPVTNVENACAGASTALYNAVTAVQAGRSDVVLVLGVEKMFMDDTTATLSALQSAGDLDVVATLGLQFTAVYAMKLQAKLQSGELTRRHLYEAAVKSHANGALNPYAQFQKPVTVEQVAASRPIADPLTLLMCSSLTDGAAAAVVAREGVLPPTDRPVVRVRASELRSGRTGAAETESAAVLASHAAYEKAGLGPSDIDVAEVHDAMAPGEFVYYESLGFCAPGQAGAFFDSGAPFIGGSQPINPSGGLSSRGHPIGATGLAQIAEIVWQLRGEAGQRQVEGARIGLTQNSGGWLEGDPAACTIHILEAIS